MSHENEIEEAIDVLLQNTEAIKGKAFVRTARVAYLLKLIAKTGVHASECDSPACNLNCSAGIQIHFAQAMEVLIGDMSKADQHELVSLIENFEHLIHASSQPTPKGKQP